MNRPSHDVIDLAIRLIREQDSTPESPGALTADGQVTYCAAAALAAAGLQSVNVSNRNKVFSDGIGTSDFADTIREVFVEQGWSLEFCNEVMLLNNSFAPPRARSYFKS